MASHRMPDRDRPRSSGPCVGRRTPRGHRSRPGGTTRPRSAGPVLDAVAAVPVVRPRDAGCGGSDAAAGPDRRAARRRRRRARLPAAEHLLPRPRPRPRCRCRRSTPHPCRCPPSTPPSRAAPSLRRRPDATAPTPRHRWSPPLPPPPSSDSPASRSPDSSTSWSRARNPSPPDRSGTARRRASPGSSTAADRRRPCAVRLRRRHRSARRAHRPGTVGLPGRTRRRVHAGGRRAHGSGCRTHGSGRAVGSRCPGRRRCVRALPAGSPVGTRRGSHRHRRRGGRTRRR